MKKARYGIEPFLDGTIVFNSTYCETILTPRTDKNIPLVLFTATAATAAAITATSPVISATRAHGLISSSPV